MPTDRLVLVSRTLAGTVVGLSGVLLAAMLFI